MLAAAIAGLETLASYATPALRSLRRRRRLRIYAPLLDAIV